MLKIYVNQWTFVWLSFGMQTACNGSFGLDGVHVERRPEKGYRFTKNFNMFILIVYSLLYEIFS